MILTVLPVPPPPVRPSIAVDGGTMRSEDDLTYKLGEIIKSSTNVRKSEQEGSPAHIVTEYEQLLQVCRIPCVILTITVDTRRSSTLQPTWTTTSRVSLRRCKNRVVL